MGNIDWVLTWTTVQAVATAVAAFIVIVGAFYAKHQLDEAARARYAQVLDKIHAILGDPNVVNARRAACR